MKLEDGRGAEGLRVRGRPPDVRWIWGIGVVGCLQAVGCLVRARRHWEVPPARWLGQQGEWAADLLSAAFWVGVVCACVVYSQYRRRLAKKGEEAVERAWKDRREVRGLIYWAAALAALGWPIGVWRVVNVLRDGTGRWGLVDVVFMVLFQLVMGPLVAALVVRYDRRRLERERRVDGGLCLGCGYDLRASAGVCPECGRDGAGDLTIR